MAISNEADLGQALKNNQDTIEIEGDLIRKIVKIKATGKVAWVIAFGAIGVAVTILITTGGTGAPVSGLVGASALGILGVSATTSAISIALAAGSVAVLTTLRNYSIVEQSEDRLVLKRK
ncbi:MULTISPECIES: hypothetical protein [unclassified Shewanella]|uniref:hypothetical protein n=1 Tax=unclassified Shewanella TaxID=196818 RepID=UPI0021DA5803|nr:MULTISPECIES: hypothetical protein [unclassified Shewanella]MCU8045600.1 hypothetical protein [Shewanella sp. SM68]MCU8049927.1 hypothetical protein [Shewanella sp. SM65]